MASKQMGRPKGSVSKTSKVLDEYIRNRLLHKSDVTPLEVMTEIMRRSFNAKNYDMALEAATRAAPYWHKKLPNAVELSGTDGAELTIQVVKFGEPAAIIDAVMDTDTDDADAPTLPHVATYSLPEIQAGVAVLRDDTGVRISVQDDDADGSEGRS